MPDALGTALGSAPGTAPQSPPSNRLVYSSGGLSAAVAAAALAKPVREAQTLSRAVMHSLGFTIELIAYGLVGGLAGVMLLVGFRLAPGTSEKFAVDLAARDVIVLVAQRNWGIPLLDLFVYNGWTAFHVPFVLTPSLFLLVVKATHVQGLVVALAHALGVAVFCWSLVTTDMPWLLRTAIVQAPFLSASAGLAATFPRRSRMWAKGLMLASSCAAGQALTVTLSMIPASERRILLTCVILPAARELGVTPMRLLVRALNRMEVQTTGVVIKTHLTWGFALVYQTAFSIVSRLITASISGSGMVLSIVLQAVLELTLRLTMAKRDKLLWRAFSRSYCWRGAVAPRRYTAVQLTTRKDTSVSLINGEMLAEYIAIWFQMLALLTLRDMPLTLTLQAFANMKPPYEEPLSTSGIVLATFGMLATEVAVDTLCCVAENRRIGSARLQHVWHMSKVADKLRVIVLVSCIATASSMLLIVMSRHTDHCWERNICLCASGNGLRNGTLDQAYCDFKYADSGGRPPGVHVYFTLGSDVRAAWPRLRLDKELLQPSFPVPLSLLGDVEIRPAGATVAALRSRYGAFTQGRTDTLPLVVAVLGSNTSAAVSDYAVQGSPCGAELPVLHLASLDRDSLRLAIWQWLQLDECSSASWSPALSWSSAASCEAWARERWSCML